MRLPPRRVLTPTAPSSTNKRKEREVGFDGPKPSTANSITKVIKPGTSRPGSEPSSSKRIEPASSNQILAGYLAHEFLTKGSLFGETWDSARAELAKNVPAEESRTGKQSEKGEAEPNLRKVEPQLKKKKKNERYVAVANLLKTGGAQFPGVFNPTQLGRFLQL
ncbi:putative Embryo sac development arrest 6 [Quillaja saponaria]|uniref:Embryo sac development arrest 6 n=1 Tax=Quillaja saponaria TaxID=32244 RepID=A0AAD7Q9K9_QUISA|nr:putative Embryo sac development arrest 6 [Quillaja saponaria]